MQAQSRHLTSGAIAKSIERQLACRSKVRPVSTIVELQKLGVLSKHSYQVVDSKNYFRTRGRIKVFGFLVRDIFGFGPKRIFTAGPGTQPPPLIGVIVHGDVAKAKSKLSRITSRNLAIEEADNAIWKRPTSQKLTEIVCYEWL